jgi:transposase
VTALRAEFANRRQTLRSSDLVFIDECSSNAAMSRRYGRARRGRRAHDSKPVNYGPNLTIVGALTLDGLSAAMTIPGATTTEVFLAFVTEVLCPILREGMLVIMDNLAAHKAEVVVTAIEATGAKVLFLPPYSPDLNPIERAWSKLKNYLRGIGARTLDTLTVAVGEALQLLTSSDCRGWFRHSGYDPST